VLAGVAATVVASVATGVLAVEESVTAGAVTAGAVTAPVESTEGVLTDGMLTPVMLGSVGVELEASGAVGAAGPADIPPKEEGSTDAEPVIEVSPNPDIDGADGSVLAPVGGRGAEGPAMEGELLAIEDVSGIPPPSMLPPSIPPIPMLPRLLPSMPLDPVGR